ncbi:MAG: hypothetical protein EP346_06820 [Bacteroidetes bacterium]|nr:MAG: hypothetical protein EP346_06820 [Bacteroidota bacterium]
MCRNIFLDESKNSSTFVAMKGIKTIILLVWASATAFGQQELSVHVSSNGEAIPFAVIEVSEKRFATDLDGEVTLVVSLPAEIEVTATGYLPRKLAVNEGKDLNIELQASREELHQVVVTASRTHLDRRESPVAIQVLGAELLRATQSVTAAEGLSFRPGLRVEYNCQNCGFSQVRLNGLNGPYSQILIDGRPIFSALSGVYGLEQIPSTMIERVEIVRGGGSSLYGANAIAGTINIITIEPVTNEWSISNQMTFNGLTSPDYSLQGSAAWVEGKSGLQVWGSSRIRSPFNANPDALYDRDGDGVAETQDDFSEITKLRAFSGGAKYWYRPTSRERWQVEARGLYEFRRGGNRFEYEPHRADIAEQLIHHTGAANAQYEWLSKDGNTQFSAYAAGALTKRGSYYGAGGNSPDSTTRAQAANYYGNTFDEIANAGALIGKQLGIRHSVLMGIDMQYNRVNDEIPGYGRSILQTVVTPAIYAQWKWKLDEHWTTEIGARYDRPTVLSNNSFAGETASVEERTFQTINPRLSLLYKMSHHFRLRASYATGFRAPQAFDEDLHLSTLGGSARITQLSEDLQVERSNSYNLGMEWDYHFHPWEGRLSIDGFYTHLLNPFVDQPFTGVVTSGSDTIALLDTKVNDVNGAYVSGVNIETEWSHPEWTVQLGYTLQVAKYGEEREWYPGEYGDDILRAPSQYGYLIVGYIPNERWRFDLSTTFTGQMTTPNERLQTLVRTPSFIDANASLQRTWKSENAHFTAEAGVYNFLNQYQPDVEVGWERDASYFYGPIRPLSIYLGFTVGM